MVISLAVAEVLGPWGLGAAAVGLLLAWAQSAPPMRLKENGWWGNAAYDISCEGLAWVTSAVVMAGGAVPGGESLALALAALYSAGAHGIMLLNDLKAVAGDRQMGVHSPTRCAWTPAAPTRASRCAARCIKCARPVA